MVSSEVNGVMQIMHSFSSLITPKSSSENLTLDIDYMIYDVSDLLDLLLLARRHLMKINKAIKML